MPPCTNNPLRAPIAALLSLAIAVTTFILPGWAQAEGSLSEIVVDSPAQLNYPYFEDDRHATSTGLNGRTFDSGFTFSVWFYFKKFADRYDGILGNSWANLRIESPGDGNLTMWFKQENGNFPAVEMNQWVNLAVTAGDGQVRFFKNGEQVSEVAMADTTVTFPTNEQEVFNLGFFWGYAKQLKVWDTVLTEGELQAEIAIATSTVNVPVHQWMLDEGIGSEMYDSGSASSAPFIYQRLVIWKHVNSPYEILLESEIMIRDAEKPLPGSEVVGSADFNQDGINEVFVHGGNDAYFPDYNIPMLVLQVDGNEGLVDASASLIEGGLYYRDYPVGRETVVADLNGDGYDDIFSATSSGHAGSILPEPSILLLSEGDSGHLVPADDQIKTPPCTLQSPMYEGQKPCQTSDSGGIVYPDEDAPLVNMSHLDYGHATSSGDIDRDGDLDLYVQTIYGGERDDLPVCSYFLINDGAGNFTANWQLVPHKAFKYNSERFEGGELNNMIKDMYYNFGKLSDFDQDGFLDMALTGVWSKMAELLPPPDNPFDVETEYPWRSVYELIAWGDEDGFSEEYTILWTKGLPTPAYRGSDTEPFAIDFDNDGDEDLIINRVNDSGFPGSWLQIFRNEGGRVFEDVTDKLLPQTLEEISARPRSVNLEPHDLNQDGCLDFIAMQDFPGPDLSRIWLNDCRGRFTPVRDSLFGKVGMMIPLDLDNDGGLDFISINHWNDASGDLREATILKQIAPIDVRPFVEQIFFDGFE